MLIQVGVLAPRFVGGRGVSRESSVRYSVDEILPTSGRNQLRGVNRYASEFDVAHLRDDLQVESKSAGNCRRHRTDDPSVPIQTGNPGGAARPSGSDGPQLRERAVIQIPSTEKRSVLATFDPNVGRDLPSFIADCEEHVLDSSRGETTR